MSQAANESQQDGILQHLFSSKWHSIHALYSWRSKKNKKKIVSQNQNKKIKNIEKNKQMKKLFFSIFFFR